MQEMGTNKYADKIAKLLRLAESAGTEEEADTALQKAQQLMTAYSIDEMMIAKARGENQKVREEIIEMNIEYTGIFQAVLMDLGSAVARNNNCRCLYSKREKGWERDPETGKTKPKAHLLHVIGFESDVRRTIMLDASLQLQQATAVKNWSKENVPGWASKMESFKMRRSFLAGFAQGVAQKLHEARVAGEAEAAQNEAARSNVTETEATESVALELRSRKDQVNDWVDQKYGRLRSSRSRGYQSGGYGAHSAGAAAGRAANTGGPSVGGGSRGELGR